MGEFRMPSLGADMEAGTVVEWRVQPGDAVKRGDIVLLVETEKGLIEVEVFESGVVEKLLVPEGEKVAVGTPLATIRSGGEAHPAPPAKPAEPEATTEPAAPPESSAVEAPAAPGVAEEERQASPVAATPALRSAEKEGTVPAGPAKSSQRRRVSPLARRVATELGVDLEHVAGTGERGAVTKADVERAAGKAAKPAPAAAAAEPARPGLPSAAQREAMRRAIGAAMSRSKREIPHYYLGTRIDMSRALAWLEQENLNRSVADRLLPAVLLLRAVALAVGEVPEMNGFWVDGAFRPGDGVHVGVAISLRQGGLVAPAIHDADRMSLDDLMRAMLDLVKRARTGVLRSSEISDATITVTNLGEQGVETVFGVIYPPQVALVGFGRVVEQPWAEEGMVGVRPVVTASLAADHRASDGHRGGRFLAAIGRLLQEPG